MTNTSRIGKAEKSAPQFMLCPKQDLVSKTKKMPSQSETKDLVAPTLHKQSPIGEISDLLDNVPFNACVEFNRRSSHPSEPSLQDQLFGGLSLKNYPNCS